MNAAELNRFNLKIIEEFRANAGKVGGDFAGSPMLLLTTTGARSGLARVNPLVYTKDGDRYVIIASKAGAPEHPHWFHNLVANPLVTVEVGTETFAARATVVEGEERQRLYAQQAERMPVFQEYAAKAGREIPVVVLEKMGD